MKSRKGQAGLGSLFLMQSAPYIVGGLTVLILTVVGLGFFFDKIMLLVAVAGIGFALLYNRGQGITPRSVLPIMAVAIISPFLLQMAGITPSVTGMTASVTGAGDSCIDAPCGDMQIDVEDNEPIQTAATFVAPRTFREVKVAVKNEDPNLPLNVDDGKVIAWVGQCSDLPEDQDPHKLCDVEQGEQFRMNDAVWQNVVDATKRLIEGQHVGITAEKPSDRSGFFNKYTSNWKYQMVQSDFQDSKVLWTEQACKENGELINEDIDCSDFSDESNEEFSAVKDFGVIGYVYADEKAETPSTHTLNVMVLDSTEGGIVDAVYGEIVGHEYRVIAKNTDTVQVQNADTTLIVVLGSLGVILGLIGYAARSGAIELPALPIPA